MFDSAGSINRLINLMARMPGIGRKSATRLAFHILNLTEEEALEIADTIREVKEKVKFCSVCFNVSEHDPCSICSDSRRDNTQICVVETAQDVVAMEKVDGFRGLFHVLGGHLSPLDGIGPDDLHIKELITRLGDSVTEIIIATNPSVEGEATAQYIAKIVRPLGPKVTRIARGLPVGSDLEYADSMTLTRALDGRQDI